MSWADSAMLVANLQPYERLKWMLVNGVLTEFLSPDPGTVSGIDVGTGSATAVSDWDGDGDLDLFIAHEDGLRVFRNIGTGRNWNFSEITSGFSALVGHLAGITRPVLAGGDWNGDGNARNGLPDWWKMQHGLNPLAANADLDPEHDGLPNLLEYAFGGNPAVADASERGIQAGRVAVGGESFLGVGFYRRTGDATLNFRLQESRDLGFWNDLNLSQ